MSSAFVEMFKHNLWANMKVLNACAEMSDKQLDAEFPGTYGSIRNTLLHIFGAEERYVASLQGQPRPPSRERAGFTGFDDLRSAATMSGEALIQIAERDAPMEMLKRVKGDGTPFEVANTILLTQAINHATEHRAHINTVRTHLGLEPCEIDGWAYGDEHGLVKG